MYVCGELRRGVGAPGGGGSILPPHSEGEEGKRRRCLAWERDHWSLQGVEKKAEGGEKPPWSPAGSLCGEPHEIPTAPRASPWVGGCRRKVGEIEGFPCLLRGGGGSPGRESTGGRPRAACAQRYEATLRCGLCGGCRAAIALRPAGQQPSPGHPGPAALATGRHLPFPVAEEGVRLD